ncbi:restriction endonuclease [Bacillaceae bacterium Marseille-Q3522]|nr:restriction endonuclease [Bacillaceae bacterium Marseille-Q3522]
MSKSDKKKLIGLLNSGIFILSFYIWYKYSLNIFTFFIMLFAPSLFVITVVSLTPTKKRKYNYKSGNNKNLKKKSHPRIPYNRLLSDTDILNLDLKDISARELERLCYLYYKSKGYRVNETKSGADGGVDLTYYHPKNGKTAVQIKHYIHSKRQITVEKIRELDAAKKNYGCVFSEFITTSTFTLPALAEAPRGMETKDINWFNREVIPWMKKKRK